MDKLTDSGRRTRLAVTLAAAALLLGGTLWGSDDLFPFGPFRMYAGVNPPNEPAPDPRVEGVTADGAVIPLDEAHTGLRRAEVEGWQDSFVADPSSLRRVLAAYDSRHPDGPKLVDLRYVNRMHEIHQGRPTGHYQDVVLADWRVPA
jgi:hypothetical protein